MISYATQQLALAEEVTEREGNILVRFVDGDVRSYQWVTSVDVDELLSYGYDDFEIVIDGDVTVVYSASSPDVPAHVDSSQWDDRDNG